MKFGEAKKKGQFTGKDENVGMITDQDYPTETPVEYTSKAFSMGRHPESGFAIFTVSFNPVTGEAKVTDTKRTGDSRADAEYYFKIAVGQYMADIEAKS